jgi:hypothetical protein
VTSLLGLDMGPSTALVFLTLMAAFWAIFMHMAAELCGVPSRFRSAAMATLVGWIIAEVTCMLTNLALTPAIVAGAVGSYLGMRIFYKVAPLRSLMLFIVTTLVTITIFGGIVWYMSMQRSRIH